MKNLNSLYPWQLKDYVVLTSMLNKLPHSLLLHSNISCGEINLINEYVKFLLCETSKTSALNDNSAKYPCNNCNPCTLFINNNHPDYYVLAPDVKLAKKNISVDEIRKMVEFLALPPHVSSRKVILLSDTGWLNISSSNALLKILEEPPSYAIFILKTTNISNVLPTIKSRSHIYNLQRPSVNEAIKYIDNSSQNNDFWLNYYDNSPIFDVEITESQLDIMLKTLKKPSIENIIASCLEFDGKKVSFGLTLDFLSKWLQDLVSLKMFGNIKYFKEHELEVSNLIAKLELEKAFYLFDQINFFVDLKNHPLNYKLQLENLFFQYQTIFTK